VVHTDISVFDLGLLFDVFGGRWACLRARALWCRLRRRPRRHTVGLEEPHRGLPPSTPPPLPAEAWSLLSGGQMTPHRLFYPAANVRNAPTRGTEGHVLHPPAHDGVGRLDEPLARSSAMASADRLEVAPERGALLEPGCPKGQPPPRATAEATKRQAQTRSPNLNTHAERWVRSVKDECLSRLILFGDASLRRALHEYHEYADH
jgi:hypothetical protein